MTGATPLRPATAGGYLELGLYAFAVVGWELVLLLVEPLFPGGGALGRSILHWSLTGAGWLVGAVVLLRVAVRRHGFAPDGPAPARPLAHTAAVAGLVVACVAIRWAGQGGAIPAVAEFRGFVEEFGAGAWPALVVQWLYYAAEVAMMALVVAFGQRAGELRFGRPSAPWGGLLLALTWGSVHVVLQGVGAGLYGMVLSVAFGAIFVLTGRSLRRSYIPLAVAFIL